MDQTETEGRFTYEENDYLKVKLIEREIGKTREGRH